MLACKALLLSALTFTPVLAQSHGSNASKEMGPVAFMWPPDRVWGAEQDNTPPCGSVDSVKNRTTFPLVNGQIALVAQDESWSIQVAISYSNEPTTLADFRTIIDGYRISELDEGHTCFRLPNPSATDNIRAGSNATLQISYTSDFEENRNQTFYACADITYIPVEQFTYQVPCFNATDNDFEIIDANSTQSRNSTVSSSSSNSGASGSGGLSSGAIAGIVVGVVVGVGAAIGAGIWGWRKKQQVERLRAHQASVRNVKWDGQSASGTSERSGDVGQQDIALSDIRK